jgi:hypothetical protein
VKSAHSYFLDELQRTSSLNAPAAVPRGKHRFFPPAPRDHAGQSRSHHRPSGSKLIDHRTRSFVVLLQLIDKPPEAAFGSVEWASAAIGERRRDGKAVTYHYCAWLIDRDDAAIPRSPHFWNDKHLASAQRTHDATRQIKGFVRCYGPDRTSTFLEYGSGSHVLWRRHQRFHGPHRCVGPVAALAMAIIIKARLAKRAC